MELARSLELRSGAYHAPALPVELYQRSWRGDTITPPSQNRACRGPRFERRSRTYEARALPTELHQRKPLEAAGRIALPMIYFQPQRTKTAFAGNPCFAGRRLAVLATPPQPWSGVRELHPCFRPPPLRAKTARVGDPGLAIRGTAPMRTPRWSEQRELNSRHQLGRLRHQPLYHARPSKNSGRGDRIRTC